MRTDAPTFPTHLDDDALIERVRTLHGRSCTVLADLLAHLAELDRRQEEEIELAYFGLLPDFIGKGLGSYLLDWAVETAWAHNPIRLWVHTCDFDHPGAFAVYQRAGFAPYEQEVEIIDDPRLKGLIPMHVKTPAEQHEG